MACKQSVLVEAINAYATSKASQNRKLQELSAAYLESILDTVDYAPEEEEEAKAVEAVVTE